MEENFRGILEQTLSSFLDRPVPVKYAGTNPFDFKTLKRLLPGEIVFVSMNTIDGASGKILYAFSKEAAGMLGDLLLMGDGNAAFKPEEHLEPILDLVKEVMGTFGSELGKLLNRHIAFEDTKGVLIDLTPTDFADGSWTMGQYEIGLTKSQSVLRMVSKEFVEACFPATGELSGRGDHHEDELHDDTEQLREMGLLLDIELPISIELGRTSMLIRDIVRLAPGSIVELDKLSGEPVDLYVNNKRFGRGEVVVVDENFAVRITELISPEERFGASRN
jgi:flagellar motor switch protein FliN